MRPRVDTRVRFTVIPTNQQILGALGKVVRHSERGFAIEFDAPRAALYNAAAEDIATVGESK